MNEQKLFTIVKALALFGTLLSVYLLWQQFYTPAFQPCSINSWINCDAVINGPVAYTFGLPTPLYGLIGYIVILVSSFLQKRKVLLATATFGLLFCLWIAYVELFELSVLCPVCIACQVTMAAVFGIAIKLNQKKKSNA